MKLKLENRKCKGCTETFRITKHTKQKFCSIDCQIINGKTPGSKKPNRILTQEISQYILTGVREKDDFFS